MAKKFEYRYFNTDNLIVTLNAIGDDGWEAVHVVGEGHVRTIYAKREIENKPDPVTGSPCPFCYGRGVTLEDVAVAELNQELVEHVRKAINGGSQNYRKLAETAIRAMLGWKPTK